MKTLLVRNLYKKFSNIFYAHTILIIQVCVFAIFVIVNGNPLREKRGILGHGYAATPLFTPTIGHSLIHTPVIKQHVVAGPLFHAAAPIYHAQPLVTAHSPLVFGGHAPLIVKAPWSW